MFHVLIGLFLAVLVLLTPMPALANTGNCALFRTWNTGDSLTAPDLNASLTRVGIDSLNTDCLASFSATVTQMQSTRDPYVSGAEVLTTSTTGELQALRFALAKATGWGQWYRHTDRVAIASHNWLTNPSVETWTNGTAVAPTGWTLTGAGATVARNSSNVKHAGFSVSLTRAGTDTYLAQDVAALAMQGPVAWWQGRAVTMGAWARATVAGRARICVDDGVGTTCSSYHTGGSSFEYLALTRTLDIAATKVEARLRVDTGDTTAQFDGAALAIGPTVTDALPPTQAASQVPQLDFNWTFNGDQEIWGAGNSAAPTGWTLVGAGATVAKNTTTGQFKIGTASVSLTRAGTDLHLLQSVHLIAGFDPVARWQGKTVTFGMWVRATVANRARIAINDGVGQTSSDYHSGGSAFEFLKVTRTIDNAATLLETRALVDTGDTTAQFDGAILVIGASVSDVIPSGQEDALWKGHGQGRLVFASSTSVLLVRHNGRFLVINTRSEEIPGGGVSLSNSGLSASTFYYVYAFMSAGVMTLEASTSAPVVFSNNGVVVKNVAGGESHTLVGILFTNSATQFEDGPKARHVRSYFNRKAEALFNVDLGSAQTISTTGATVEVPNSRVSFVAFGGEVFHGTAQWRDTTQAATLSTVYLGAGIDGASSLTSSLVPPSTNAIFLASTVVATVGSTAGQHYGAMFVFINSGGGNLSIGQFSSIVATLQPGQQF